jgi:hypothetical protein
LIESFYFPFNLLNIVLVFKGNCMLHLIKKFFGIVPSTPAVEAPYKVDAPTEVGKSANDRVEAPAPVVAAKPAPVAKAPVKKAAPAPVAEVIAEEVAVEAAPKAKKAPAKKAAAAE